MNYRDVLGKVASAFIPKGGMLKYGGEDVPISNRLEFFIRAFGREPRFIKIFFIVFNFMPIMLFFSTRPFTALSEEKRADFLRKLKDSKFFVLRLLFFLLKMIIVSTFYSIPEVCREIGYKAECER